MNISITYFQYLFKIFLCSCLHHYYVLFFGRHFTQGNSVFFVSIKHQSFTTYWSLQCHRWVILMFMKKTSIFTFLGESDVVVWMTYQLYPVRFSQPQAYSQLTFTFLCQKRWVSQALNSLFKNCRLNLTTLNCIKTS